MSAQFGKSWSWQSKPMRQPWHSMLLMLVSIVLVSSSAQFFFRIRAFSKNGIETSAVVKKLEADREIRVTALYADTLGETHEITFPIRTPRNKYRVGSKISLVYMAGDPSQATAENLQNTFKAAIALCVMGAIFAALSVFLWLFRRILFPQYRDKVIEVSRDDL